MLSRKGKPINMIDVLLTGQALELGASIVTNGRDFLEVGGGTRAEDGIHQIGSHSAKPLVFAYLLDRLWSR